MVKTDGKKKKKKDKQTIFDQVKGKNYKRPKIQGKEIKDKKYLWGLKYLGKRIKIIVHKSQVFYAKESILGLFGRNEKINEAIEEINFCDKRRFKGVKGIYYTTIAVFNIVHQSNKDFKRVFKGWLAWIQFFILNAINFKQEYLQENQFVSILHIKEMSPEKLFEFAGLKKDGKITDFGKKFFSAENGWHIKVMPLLIQKIGWIENWTGRLMS